VQPSATASQPALRISEINPVKYARDSAVNCADGNYPDSAQIRTLQSQWRGKYPLFGAALATGLLGCSVWPAKKDPYPTGKAAGAPPILVVGTTGDPATPYAGAEALLARIQGSGLLTFDSTEHTAYSKNACIDAAVNAYLLRGTLPRDGKVCAP